VAALANATTAMIVKENKMPGASIWHQLGINMASSWLQLGLNLASS